MQYHPGRGEPVVDAGSDVVRVMTGFQRLATAVGRGPTGDTGPHPQPDADVRRRADEMKFGLA